MNRDTICWRQALTAYRIRNADERPVSELPESTLSELLRDAQRRKARPTTTVEENDTDSEIVKIAKEYDAIAFRLVEHYRELRFEQSFVIMLVLEDIFEDDIREIARNNGRLCSLKEEDIASLINRSGS